MTLRVRTAALVLCCLLALAADARPDGSAEAYLQPYRSGFNAFNLFRWEKAAAEMRKAIALNPTESGKDVHIQLLAWKPYVPHFYLGISLAKLGRCADAVPALRESLRQGVLPDTRGFRGRAESTLRECLASLPKEDPRVQTVSDDPPAAAPATETQPASREVPSERNADKAESTATQPPESAPVTTSASNAATPTTAAAAPSRHLPVVPERRVESKPSPADRPEVLLSAPARDVPPALVTAVDAYLGGRYADAVRILDTLSLADVRQRGHALLFRAASLHALFVVGQRRDASLEKRAARDIAELRRLRPGTPADPRVFSPPFLEFFRQTR